MRNSYISGIIRATRLSDAAQAFLIGTGIGMVLFFFSLAKGNITLAEFLGIGTICGVGLSLHAWVNNYWREG